MKQESQRIDYLIGVLSKGNARAFAHACGIDPSAISKLRRGVGVLRPEHYFPYILAAFPTVSKDWLYEGKGKPLISVEWTIDDYRQECERLWRLVEQYEGIIADYRSILPKNLPTTNKK